jgi:hypothetical protein
VVALTVGDLGTFHRMIGHDISRQDAAAVMMIHPELFFQNKFV